MWSRKGVFMKSKRSKATDIPMSVKKKVWERDCGKVCNLWEPLQCYAKCTLYTTFKGWAWNRTKYSYPLYRTNTEQMS